MARIKGPKSLGSNLITPPKIPQNENIVFSFNFYHASHPLCNASQKEARYFNALLARLKSIGTMKVSEFRTAHARPNAEALRIHRIHWKDTNGDIKTFGISNRQDLDNEAWQFAIDQQENGRVHGFLIDTVFHVVWLDPDHVLYPPK